MHRIRKYEVISDLCEKKVTWAIEYRERKPDLSALKKEWKTGQRQQLKSTFFLILEDREGQARDTFKKKELLFLFDKSWGDELDVS